MSILLNEDKGRKVTKKPQKLRVLFAAAEATPLIKVGGLADVAGSLPLALQEEGVEVKTLLPFHGALDYSSLEKQLGGKMVKVENMHKTVHGRLFIHREEKKVPIYLLEGEGHFPRPQAYGYDDDLNRYQFFSKAIPLFPQWIGWKPDIIHLHDWHTASTPLWTRSYGLDYKHVLTIHNLAYQGLFDNRFLAASELGEMKKANWEYGEGRKMSMMALGILYSEAINTVSETYSQEILTPEFGEGLETLLLQRKDSLFGILNGIDVVEYNPATDPYLPGRYDLFNLAQRPENKSFLQSKLGLPVKPRTMLFGMVSRLDEQKGLDLLVKCLDVLFTGFDMQFVILGRGREQYQEMLQNLAKKYPENLSLTIAFDNPLAHLIYGGCDVFLMPSRFEPCGLGQMIAMRYGAVPLVRSVGGLADTVFEKSPDWSSGRGFVFKSYEPEALIASVNRAIHAYQDEIKWIKLQESLMSLDFSWKASAKKYIGLYKWSLKRKG